MNLKLVILGSGGTTPSRYRNTPAMHGKYKDCSFLLQVGQGCQRSMLTKGLDFFVDFIVISHLHYDHFSGLLTYLRTMALLDRRTDLRIYSPKISVLKNYVSSLFAESAFPYAINYVEITPYVEYVQKEVVLEFFPVIHSVLTYGVELKSLKNDKYRKQDLQNWGTIKEIRELMDEGTIVKDNQTYYKNQFIECSKLYFKVVYSGDTQYMPSLIDRCDQHTLLIHECTYYFKQDYPLAAKKKHTHFADLKVKTPVVLLHFGSKLTPEFLKKVKKPSNIHFSEDGMEITINGKNNILQIK